MKSRRFKNRPAAFSASLLNSWNSLNVLRNVRLDSSGSISMFQNGALGSCACCLASWLNRKRFIAPSLHRDHVGDVLQFLFEETHHSEPECLRRGRSPVARAEKPDFDDAVVDFDQLDIAAVFLEGPPNATEDGLDALAQLPNSGQDLGSLDHEIGTSRQDDVECQERCSLMSPGTPWLQSGSAPPKCQPDDLRTVIQPTLPDVA